MYTWLSHWLHLHAYEAKHLIDISKKQVLKTTVGKF